MGNKPGRLQLLFLLIELADTFLCKSLGISSADAISSPSDDSPAAISFEVSAGTKYIYPNTPRETNREPDHGHEAQQGKHGNQKAASVRICKALQICLPAGLHHDAYGMDCEARWPPTRSSRPSRGCPWRDPLQGRNRGRNLQHHVQPQRHPQGLATSMDVHMAVMR